MIEISQWLAKNLGKSLEFLSSFCLDFFSTGILQRKSSPSSISSFLQNHFHFLLHLQICQCENSFILIKKPSSSPSPNSSNATWIKNLFFTYNKNNTNNNERPCPWTRNGKWNTVKQRQSKALPSPCRIIVTAEAASKAIL